ncbi:MAG TPA: hypothetical protein VKB78_15495, partial [Pirellulales bacterium]|nr:hypothetical protein [Pirellulales bacterium]
MLTRAQFPQRDAIHDDLCDAKDSDKNFADTRSLNARPLELTPRPIDTPSAWLARSRTIPKASTCCQRELSPRSFPMHPETSLFREPRHRFDEFLHGIDALLKIGPL